MQMTCTELVCFHLVIPISFLISFTYVFMNSLSFVFIYTFFVYLLFFYYFFFHFVIVRIYMYSHSYVEEIKKINQSISINNGYRKLSNLQFVGLANRALYTEVVLIFGDLNKLICTVFNCATC